MIDALICGRLHGAPKSRTSSNGRPFATAVVRTATRAGEAIFVNTIVFAQPAVTALLALADGDSVALAGELTPKVFVPKQGEPRPSLDLLGHQVISPYSVQRKRQAVVAAAQELPFADEIPGAA